MKFSSLTYSKFNSIVDKLNTAGAKTPSYFFDLDAAKHSLQNMMNEFQKTFPNFTLAYSYKTNSMRRLTNLVENCGGFAEVVSGDELLLAISDGFDGDRICFDGPIKNTNELELALRNGCLIQSDSVDEIKLIVELLKTIQVVPRITLRVATRLGRKRWTRLGHTPVELEESLQILSANGINPLGLHFNAGAHKLSVGAYRDNIALWASALTDLIELNSNRLTVLDIGGGFPAKSAGPNAKLPEWSHYSEGVRDELEKAGIDVNRIHLIIEPGRSIIEDHGFLMLGISVIKDRVNGRIAITDGGINLVNSLHVWHHPLAFIPTGKVRTTIYGSMCFESDVLGEKVPGPRIIDSETRVLIGSVGGYDISASRGWIRQLPEVWICEAGRTQKVDVSEVFNERRISSLNRVDELGIEKLKEKA